MKMQEIRQIAKINGLKTGKLNKTRLVKQIQSNEGNFDCFATATNDYCDQSACIWQEDCIHMSKKAVSIS